MHQGSITRTYQETLQRRYPVPMMTVLLRSSPWKLLLPPKISFFGIFIVMPFYCLSKACLSINPKRHIYTSLPLVLRIILWSPSANNPAASGPAFFFFRIHHSYLLPYSPQLPSLLLRTAKQAEISLECWWTVTTRHTTCRQQAIH